MRTYIYYLLSIERPRRGGGADQHPQNNTEVSNAAENIRRPQDETNQETSEWLESERTRGLSEIW